jgi:hypothetical protein
MIALEHPRFAIGSFDYDGFQDMPTEDAEWIKDTFRDPSSSQVELRVALWTLWWYSDEREDFYKYLTKGDKLYDIVRHRNLPSHPSQELTNLAEGNYGGKLELDVAITNQSQEVECHICGRDSSTFTEMSMNEHHISYNPEKTVWLCAECHGSVHHRNGFFDDLQPDRSSDWLNYEHQREKSETSVQVELDVYN